MNTSMQPIFFSKAGGLLLERYRCGKPSRAKGDAVFHHGSVVSITPTVNTTTQSLPDGNSDWDAAQPVTGREGSVAVELSFMSPELYAFLMGTTVEKLTNTVMTVADYEAVIPEKGDYEVKLLHEPVEGSVLIVDYEGTHFEVVDSKDDQGDPVELEKGQVTIEDNVVTFHEDDAGKAAYFAYDWIALSAVGFNFPKTGTPYAFRATVSGEAMGDDEATVYDANIIIDRAKATGNINPPPLSKTPAPQTITLTVLKPRGDKAVDFKFAKRDGECD